MVWHILNKGRLARAGEPPIEVTFVVVESEGGIFRGRIRIPKAKSPATQFERGYQPEGPREVWTLETAGGNQIGICFTHPGGAFECLNASEGRVAVAEYDELLRNSDVPLETVVSLIRDDIHKDDLPKRPL